MTDHKNFENPSNGSSNVSTIFLNNGFTLFDFILDNYVKTFRGRQSDISYYYWRLYNDGFITQSPEPFKKWFYQNFHENLGKIKAQKNVETPLRKNNYLNALEWFKQFKS